MYKVRFTLGHSVYNYGETYHFKSNYPGSKINRALREFEIESGCDIRSWCKDSGESEIPEQDTQTLVDFGIITKDELGENTKYDCEDIFGYLDLISRLIKYIIPDFNWDPESFEDEEVLYINKCGYGIWSK